MTSLCDNMQKNAYVKYRIQNEKKHESLFVIYCIILAWIYGELAKIEIKKKKKVTKKCPDCDIYSSWLKDASRNDQYGNFFLSLLSNITHNFPRHI